MHSKIAALDETAAADAALKIFNAHVTANM